MNIYLTGYRCTGKTSVGEMLAEKLGRTFIDADRFLVEEQGKSVAEIVEEGGWDLFRDLETETLKKISALDRCVVATGGGVILRPENRELMKANGIVVWLTATPDTIARRMGADSNTADQRPGLTGKGPLAEIMEVLFQRLPLYEKAMDFQVETNGRELDDICESIVTRLNPAFRGRLV